MFMMILSTGITFAIIGYLFHSYTRWNSERDEIAKMKYEIGLWKRCGWGSFGFSIANAVDVGFPFPFPVVGIASAYLSAALIAVAFILLGRYYWPKEKEVLRLASRTNGLLTLVLVVDTLGISVSHATRTIKRMFQHDLLIALNDEKKPLAESILLVRTYSGQLRTGPNNGEARPGGSQSSEQARVAEAQASRTDEAIRAENSEVANMSVDELNRMILENSLYLGRSGRPVRGEGRQRRSV